MSYILLENNSKVLLESSFGLLEEIVAVIPPFSPQLPQQGFWGSPYYSLANPSKPIKNNGGTLLGVTIGSLQSNRILSSDYGIINTGKHNYVGNLSQPPNTVKGVSNGTFGVTVANQYILMTFTSQLAGNANKLLLNSGVGKRSSGNLNYPYVCTTLDAKNGGWYYLNGQPINRQIESDFIGTDNGSNRFTFLQSGRTPYISSYKTRTN